MMMIQRTILFSLLLVAVTEGDDSPNFRRGLGKPDPSACNDPSAVLYPPGDACDFPVIVAGERVNGLPEGATLAMDSLGINAGVTPKIGFYKVGNDFSCGSVESSLVVPGKGLHYKISELDDKSQLTVTGNFILSRPAGQTSYAPEFPDQKEGIWQVSGSITFEGDDFTIVRSSGKPPFDICQYLADQAE
jgi:hypothetical protein